MRLVFANPLTLFVLALVLVAASASVENTARAEEPPAKALKYHSVLLRRPNPGYVFDRFFNTWLDESSVDELEAFLKKRVEEPGASADGLLLAFYYAKQGEELLAIEQFRKTLKNDPGNASAWYEKAVLEARALDFETALADLQKAADAKPKQEMAVRIQKLRGQLLVRSQEKEEALKVFQALVDANPTDEELAEDVIELQLGEGLYDEAAKASEKLVERTKDPYRKVLRQLRLGDIRQRSGKREAAIAIYQKTLADVGAESWLEREILAQIERVYRREENIAGLRKQYQELLEEFPRRVGVRRGYARVLADAGEAEQAIEQFREILKITPGNRGNQEAFIQLFLRTGDHAGARKQLEALIEQNPDDGELYVQLAELAKKTDDQQLAVRAVGLFLDKSDKSEYAYLRSARLLERLEFNQEAKDQYAALTGAFPESLAAKEARAAFLYKAGDKQDALALWKEAADSDDPQQAVRVARALAARQEHQVAFDLLMSHKEEFEHDSLFLAQLVDEALALKDFEQAAPLAMRRVDLADTPAELDDAVAQAAKAIERGDQLAAELARLQGKAKTVQRTCLLAELLERSGDVQRADEALATWVEGGDLLAVTQQIRLAKQRRDWLTAIDATRRLIDLPGGRKSRNVRRLVEFYERAFLIKKALEWVPEWKKLSPGSTTPWLTESRLLLSSGKTTEAIDSLRAASREFDGAPEIGTRLAQLYQMTGQLADAERIFWRSYEESDELTGKQRAVEQLARLSEMQGKTRKLVENFEERSRANRTSIEPVLALATIHRVTNNYEKRLQSLAEAAKMRPDDLQLLRQIARIEEREGEWERARDTLERAAKLDKTSRTQQQIAGLLLRWGNPEEGYSLLYKSMESASADPRQVESIADAMIGVRDWERVIEFLEPRVAQWPGDYRLRYLLSIAQEEMGELASAANGFLAVVESDQEIRGASQRQPNAYAMQNSYFDEIYKMAPPGVKELLQMQSTRHQVYTYRQRGNQLFGGYTGVASSGVAQIAMPKDLEQARRYALAHLMNVVPALEENQAESLKESLALCDVPEADVMCEMGGINQNRGALALEIVEKFPEREAVVGYVILGMMGQTQGLEADFYRKAIKLFRKDYPEMSLIASVQGMLLHEELNDQTEAVTEMLAGIEDPSGVTVMMLCTMPVQIAQSGGWGAQGPGNLPEEFHEKLRNKIVEWYPGVRDSQPYGQWIFTYTVNMLKSGKDPEAYVRLLEDEVARFRQKSGKGNSSSHNFPYFGRSNSQSLLSPPSFPPAQLQRFPASVIQVINTKQNRQQIYFPGQTNEPGWKEQQLVEVLPRVGDPTLRLLLAYFLDQEEVVQSAIDELVAGETPTLDSYLLAASWETEKENLDKAIRLLEKARYLPMNRATRRSVDSQLVALVLSRMGAGLKEDELLKSGRDAALRLRHGVLQANERRQLADALDEFGLDKEAEQLEKVAATRTGQTGFAAPRISGGMYQKANPDRIRRLLDNGKKEAAAKLLAAEVLSAVRQYGQNPMNRSYARHQYQQVQRRIAGYDMIDPVIESLKPKEKKNHRKYAEYASAQEVFGNSEEAIEAYQVALELKPTEDAYRIKLIVAECEADKLPDAIARLEDLGYRGADALVGVFFGCFQDHEIEIAERLNLAELALELFKLQADEPRANRAWSVSLLQNLSNPLNSHGSSLPSLYTLATDSENPPKLTADAKRRRDLHDQFCRAMLGDDELARDGFTGLLASHEATGEVDQSFVQLATKAIKNAKRPRSFANAHGGHVVYHNYGVSTPIAPRRTPGEYLVQVCWRSSDWSLLDDDVLPHLKSTNRSDLARQIDEYRKLYECDPADFPEAATDFVRRRAVMAMHGVTAPSRPQMKSYEVWLERKLEIDIEEVMLAFAKESLKRSSPNSPLPFVMEYTEEVARQSGADRAAQWLEKLAVIYIGPRDKRKELIAKNYQQNQISWGTPNAAIHGFRSTLQNALSRGPLVLPTVRFIAGGELDGLVQNASGHLRNGLRQAMPDEDADLGIEFLEQAGMLADPPALQLDRLSDADGDSLFDAVAYRLRKIRNKEAGKEIIKRLAEREEQTLGVLMVRCALDEDPKLLESLIAHLGQKLNELDALPAEQRQAIGVQLGAVAAKVMGAQQSELEDSVEKAREALDWLKAQKNGAASSRSKKVLAAKRFEELKVEAHQIDDWLVKLLPSIAQDDPESAAKVYFKVMDLYKEAVNRNAVHMYYGNSMSYEILSQMSYRLDQSAPSTTRLILALFHNEGAERITLSRHEIRRFFQPLTSKMRTFQQQADKAKAGPLGAIKPFYAWVRETYGADASPLLILGYYEALGSLGNKNTDEAEKWLAAEAISGEDGRLANDLLAVIQYRRAVQSQSRDEIPETADHFAHFEQVLADAKHPLSVRLTLGCALVDNGKPLPLSTAKAIGKVGVEACRTEIPLGYDQERNLASNGLALVEESAGDEVAAEFAEAWLARFVTKKPANNSRTSAYEARDTYALMQMTAMYFRQGAPASAKNLLRRYDSRIGQRKETLGILVGEGEIDIAARLIRTRWSEIPTTGSSGVPIRFDKKLQENLPKLVEKLGEGPLAFLAEAALSTLDDLPEEERGDLPSREQRMVKIAERFSSVKFQSSDMTAKTLMMLSDSEAATDLVAEPLEKLAKRIDLVQLAAANSNNFDEAAELLLQYGRSAARRGDPKPLVDMFLALSKEDANNDWRLHNTYRSKFQVMTNALQENFEKFDDESLQAIVDGVQHFIRVRENVQPSSFHDLNVLHAVAHARRGSVDDYLKWLEKIESKQRDYIKQRGADRKVFEYTFKELEKGDPKAVATRIERMARLLQIAEKSGWIEYKNPTNLRFRSRGGTTRLWTFAFFTNEELPTAAPAVAEKAPAGGFTWAFAAAALTKAQAHEQAAHAWGKAYEFEVAGKRPNLLSIRAFQIESLEKAGKLDEARKLLRESLGENLTNARTKKRYDELTKRLLPDEVEGSAADTKTADAKTADGASGKQAEAGEAQPGEQQPAEEDTPAASEAPDQAAEGDDDDPFSGDLFDDLFGGDPGPQVPTCLFPPQRSGRVVLNA